MIPAESTSTREGRVNLPATNSNKRSVVSTRLSGDLTTFGIEELVVTNEKPRPTFTFGGQEAIITNIFRGCPSTKLTLGNADINN